MARRTHPDSPRKARAAEFAAILASALYDLGLTHQDLAKALGVTRYAVDSWTRANNSTLPADQNLERLCYLLEQRQAGLGQKLARLAGGEWMSPAGHTALSPTAATTSAEPPSERIGLRAPPTSFIGHEREIEEITQMLTITRLVTLTGPGGIGKTRLAFRLATELVADFADGVRLIELASLTDASLIPNAIALALGVQEQLAMPLSDRLVEHLRDKHLLMVLDNCEHLVSACATLVVRLLQGCPQLRILATSREALRIAGEATCQIAPLSLPDQRRTSQPLMRPMQYEAIRLFVERALFMQRGFVLTSQNASAISKICQRLDGLPLAIELAAARVRDLPVEEIAARLDDRFRLLTSDGRTRLMSQHQTLRAALDWSYGLLTSPERTLFRRLSVFAGGWQLGAAQAICGEPSTTTSAIDELLSQLQVKSLIVVAECGAEIQYRMLETIREYVREHLDSSAEGEMLRQQHAAYFLAFAEQAEAELTGSNQAIWFERLENAHDNLRAALGWALNQADPELALRLCAALWRFWQVRGHLSEGRARLADALAKATVSPPTAWHAATLNGAGVLARQQGDYAAAREFYAHSLALYRRLGDPGGIATLLNDLGIVVAAQGDFATARSDYEESLSIWRTLGNQQGIATSVLRLGIVAFAQGDHAVALSLCEQSLAIWRELGDQVGMIHSLNGLGEVARAQDNYELAANHYDESLRLSRALGHKWGMAAALHNLGHVAHQQGDLQSATSRFAESLSLYRELGDPRGVIECLLGLGGVHGVIGKPECAARLFGSVQAMFETLDTRLTPNDRVAYDRNVNLARAQLAPAAFASAWQAGQRMSMEQAIAHALGKHQDT